MLVQRIKHNAKASYQIIINSRREITTLSVSSILK